MTTIPIIVLKLSGPMQSWGVSSRWNFRDTAPDPTKSGVIGLLACAMGYRRSDKRIETVLDKSLKIGVRVDRPGVITTDYHTVTGRHTIATGKSKIHTELTHRSYIEDASFLIIITGPEDLLQEIENALKNPKWPVFLGRKSCPPTRPVFDRFTTEYSSIKEALELFPWNKHSPKEKAPEQLRCVVEDDLGDILRKDAIRINPARIYGTRRITEYWVKNPLLE